MTNLKTVNSRVNHTPKDERPQIQVNVPVVLEAYCRWIFKTPESESKITIDRNEDIGKHIFSHVKATDHPKKRPVKGNMVTFILPMTDNAWLALRKNFLTIDDWGEMKVNNFIESEFNNWCKEKFWKGYFWGWKQKEITSAILRGLNLRSNEINEAAIIKNDYRRRRKEETERFKKLQELEL